jgi:sec-independent protein translocase protein TatA
LVMGLGPGEIILIILAILLLFGGRKIPELMRSLGEGVREFKKASKGLTEEEPPAPGPKSDSVKIREAASALGIATEGKSDDQLRAEISAKMGQ